MRLLARADWCQPHLCPHRYHVLQGTSRSPGYSTSHICPSPHPFTLMKVLVETPRPQMEQHTVQDTCMIGRSAKGSRCQDCSSHKVSVRGGGFSTVSNSSAYTVVAFHSLCTIHLISLANTLRQESCESGHPISMGKSKVRHRVRHKGGL